MFQKTFQYQVPATQIRKTQLIVNKATSFNMQAVSQYPVSNVIVQTLTNGAIPIMEIQHFLTS